MSPGAWKQAHQGGPGSGSKGAAVEAARVTAGPQAAKLHVQDHGKGFRYLGPEYVFRGWIGKRDGVRLAIWRGLDGVSQEIVKVCG